MKGLTRFQNILILGLISLFSMVVYLAVSYGTAGLGFPLDDAWIHQVYARNLADTGKWLFSGAESSGGSTGPLWSACLAVWYWLGIHPLWGTYIWGWLLLWSVSSTVMLLYRVIPGDSTPAWGSLAAGALTALEWHLVWAAGSGMETLLFTFLVLILLLLILNTSPTPWWAAGAVSGLCVWIRPGGITLLLVTGTAVVMKERRIRGAVLGGAAGLGGFLLLFLPYLWFNQQVAGTWWPNTFYAKQAEYAALRQIPLIARIGKLGIQPLIGPVAVLMPGVGVALWRLVRSRQWPVLLGGIWAGGTILMYSLRLPVTYQHGRYLIPVIPVLILYGWWGMSLWIKARAETGEKFVFTRAWGLSLMSLLLIFWGLGARAYGRDVGVIESEMVRTARWINEHLEEDILLGAHDIGALGYFSNRKIVDLAGLVSPDVIPFIRDEARIADYLDQKGVDYLVTFPGWYPELTARAAPIYQTGGSFSKLYGSDNMGVYRWGD